jgi:hypothetical protein
MTRGPHGPAEITRPVTLPDGTRCTVAAGWDGEDGEGWICVTDGGGVVIGLSVELDERQFFGEMRRLLARGESGYADHLD